jgi:hypothetical protein
MHQVQLDYIDTIPFILIDIYYIFDIFLSKFFNQATPVDLRCMNPAFSAGVPLP